jgi:hypothetical protein
VGKYRVSSLVYSGGIKMQKPQKFVVGNMFANDWQFFGYKIHFLLVKAH